MITSSVPLGSHRLPCKHLRGLAYSVLHHASHAEATVWGKEEAAVCFPSLESKEKGDRPPGECNTGPVTGEGLNICLGMYGFSRAPGRPLHQPAVVPRIPPSAPPLGKRFLGI